MTKTRTVAVAASMTAVLLVAAVGWLTMPRTTHEIVLQPVTHGAQR